MRKIIKFDESKLGSLALTYLTKIKESESSVSIHIRRGDYLDNGNTLIYYDLCSSDYYQKAITHLDTFSKEKHTYFVFSDDLDWVKANFYLENMVTVDLGKNDSPWQDMYLMSKCNHNIISNSTFSWWGAWMNTNINRIVVAPSHWYNGINTPDLFPKGWMVVKMEDKFSFQEKISTYLLLKNSLMVYPGLLNGKMGLCIYLFRTGRVTKKSKYEMFATSLLEEIYDDIFKRSDFGFGNYGALGVAIGIHFLTQEGYIEGDSNEILSEIDFKVKKILIEDDSLSLPQICDLLKYILFRSQNNLFVKNLSEDEIFNKTVPILLKSFERNIIYDETNNKEALNILNKLRKMEIFQDEVEKVILRLIKEKKYRNDYLNLQIKNLLSI